MAHFWKTRFLPRALLASELALEHKGKRLGIENGLTLIATMATWCVACAGEIPEFNALRAGFNPEDLAIYAVPVREPPAARDEWVEIAAGGAWVGAPRWSADGTIIYYLSERVEGTVGVCRWSI